ncbi:MAG: biotin-independent malonate decarboxylase subunit gamma [Deltaproteobacteria bacterium]|nr:biotin-independent malonate decarboxylase subunit gamma [Deltaproteobacteria bacterium]
MNLDELLQGLFPSGHDVRVEGAIASGTGRLPGLEVAVLGAVGGAEVGVAEALRLAAGVLRVVRDHPGRPLLFPVDTRGQRMARREEMLGLNGALAHLAECVELARQRGHRTLGLVHGEAVSGGVLPLGFMADEVHAVPGARPAVMNLRAMARVTKIPLPRLEELSRASAVLTPGLESFVATGAIASVWQAPLDAALAAALARPGGPDRRMALGAARGGRTLAQRVAARVEEEGT